MLIVASTETPADTLLTQTWRWVFSVLFGCCLSFVFFYSLLRHPPFSHPISWVFLLPALPTSFSSLSWPLAKNSSLSSMKTPTLMNMFCLSLTHKQTMRTHKGLHTHTRTHSICAAPSLQQQDNTVISGSRSKTHSICICLSSSVYFCLRRKHRHLSIICWDFCDFLYQKKKMRLFLWVCADSVVAVYVHLIRLRTDFKKLR